MFMTLTTPDGLFFALHGSIEENRHELPIRRQSGWEEILHSAVVIEEDQYNLYENASFMLRLYSILPFNGATTNAAETYFKGRIPARQVAVGCSHKDLKQRYSLNDIKRLLKFY